MDREIQRRILRQTNFDGARCLKLTKSFFSSLLAARRKKNAPYDVGAIRLTARNHYEVAPASTIYSFRTVSSKGAFIDLECPKNKYG